MTGAIGAASLLATGRYAIFHRGEPVGEERWTVTAASDGGAVARGEQVLSAPHPLPSELEWRARLSPLGRVTAIEAAWRVGTRTVRAEHSSDGDLWRARILYGGHTREQEGDYPAFAEVLIGSHVLHTVMLHRYVLEPGAEHEFPALVIGPPWFAAEPGRQRVTCTATSARDIRARWATGAARPGPARRAPPRLRRTRASPTSVPRPRAHPRGRRRSARWRAARLPRSLPSRASPAAFAHNFTMSP